MVENTTAAASKLLPWPRPLTTGQAAKLAREAGETWYADHQGDSRYPIQGGNLWVWSPKREGDDRPREFRIAHIGDDGRVNAGPFEFLAGESYPYQIPANERVKAIQAEMFEPLPEAAELFRREYVYVGMTADRKRVLMSAEVRRGGNVLSTVDHERIASPEALSLTSAVFTGKKNISRNHVVSGATLKHLGRIHTPAPGFTLGDVRELHRIGTEWHNNTLKSACAHMDVPKGVGGSELLDMGIRCESSGYSWGTAHLVKPLPAEVRDRFVSIMSQGATEPADY